MSTSVITQNFHIPTFKEMEVPTISVGKDMWDKDTLKYKRLINQYWLKEKRDSATKVP